MKNRDHREQRPHIRCLTPAWGAARQAFVCLLATATLLPASGAVAETVVIEYPDHYYVESTGSPGDKAAPAGEGAAHRAPPLPSRENMVSHARPEDSGERRKALINEIQRLQREQSDLTAPKEGDTPEQISRKQQDAAARQMKIKRISSILEKLPEGEQGAK